MDLKKKPCTRCSEEKTLDQFHKKGKGRIQPICKSCKSLYNKDYRAANKTLLQDYKKTYYSCNRESILEKSRLFVQENKELIRAKNKAYKEKYPHRATEQNVRQKAARKASTPRWLTKEQKRQIQDFYWLAKDLFLVTGSQYEVDHIVPIKGKNVCGLHVPWNLQVLPKDINSTKRNKWNPDHD